MAATPIAEFHFDFGSPNAYLCHAVLPKIERRTGVQFTYVPVLLGGIFKLTGNVSPMVANNGITNKIAYQKLEFARFIAQHKITQFNLNPNFPVNTLAIMRGAAAAELDGTIRTYASAMFHHMWEAPKKMDEAEIIAEALQSSGLDAARLVARTADADVKARLMQNTEASVARGTFGSPTFYVGREIYFGKDRLAEVEAEIMRQKAA
jgi:2-hydroxychromene-2-carboxylate isomerase